METKSLCAKIPIDLHNKVRKKQEESNLTLNQYVEKLIVGYYEMEAKKMNNQGVTRTLAVQIPEELFERLKAYLKEHKKSQREFLMELIEREMEKTE